MPSSPAQSLFSDMRHVLPGLSLPEFAGVLAKDILRQSIQREHPKLFRQVAALLYEHDLEGIYLSGSSAYYSETALVIFGLSDCRTTLDIQRLVGSVFEDSGFSGELSRFEALALDLSRMVDKYRW
ncbi:MAG TPA: hypothetical protein P5205_20150 [Candidatus Paceibacterota bacterium]|nr:hypothetical protein [Verrucomicrobiota bacterium]HSA12679.1 hypothetical protein [Candidatus Paceibacterota bacterium]